MSSTGSASVQFFQSLFWMMMAIGEPMVCECRTPATISRAVGLDLHAAAAAVALLAPPQFAIDGVERDRDAGGQSGQRGDQALAVRLSGCFETKHGGKFYGNAVVVAFERICPPAFSI